MGFGIYKRLFKYLVPYRTQVIIILVASAALGALSTSPVPIIQKTFDDILDNKDFFMLKVVPLAIVLLYVVKAGLTYMQTRMILNISWELVAGLRFQMFKHIHKLPYGFFEKDTTGQLMSRVTNDVNTMLHALTHLVKDALQNGVMLIGLIGWIFYLKWDWALIAMLVLPTTLVPISNIARKLRRLGRRGQELLADINSIMLESFSGMKIIRAFDLEKQEKKKMQTHNDEYLHVMKKNSKYTQLTSPLMEVLGAIAGSVILWYGGYQVLTEQVTKGTFLAFVFGMFMTYDPMRRLLRSYTDSQQAVAAAVRVFEILDMEEERIQDGKRTLDDFSEAIEYKNVSFKYPTRDATVLKNIDLTVPKSSVLAIVGMSGAGKTTLADLLFKFFKVTDGEITIDGVNINEFDSLSLRRNLALVTQETFLFNDTIWANIGFGNPEAPREEILSAARAAHVDGFVQTLDDGYDTMIGERGMKLSGGQRQRIAIARAILRNAPILVLDEATSALDSESEKLVQDALHRLMEHRTTFVIAHRLSTIKNADRIIVMEQGEIVGSGTHEVLLNDCEQYQKYYQMQVFDSAD